jgi:hypothetical protein
MAEPQSDTLWILLPAAQRASGEWIDDTLKARALEKGLTARLSLAGQFPRVRVEVVRDRDPWSKTNELFYRRGWTDGLPIIPPTVGKVEEMLTHTGLSRHQVIAELDPLKGQATVEKIAINGVMAGCRPEYLPILIAATESMAKPEFNLRGVQTTDENVAPLFILSGPIVHELDINTGFGMLGPGWQANAAIGRAARLIMHNIGGGWPAAVALAGLGQPGKYTLCVGESDAVNPWEPLHAELGHPGASTLTVMRAETVVNVTGGLREIASVMGSAVSLFSMMHDGQVAVALSPYVARQLADKGWSKYDVKVFLYEHGRIRTSDWRDSWAFEVIKNSRWPRWVTAAAEKGSIPAVGSPDHITLIVAGGDLAIAQHAYFPSWGFPSCRITAVLD